MGFGEPEIDMVINYLLIRSEVSSLTYEQYCQECEYEPSEIIKALYLQDMEIEKMTKNFLGSDFEVFLRNNDY